MPRVVAPRSCALAQELLAAQVEPDQVCRATGVGFPSFAPSVATSSDMNLPFTPLDAAIFRHRGRLAGRRSLVGAASARPIRVCVAWPSGGIGWRSWPRGAAQSASSRPVFAQMARRARTLAGTRAPSLDLKSSATSLSSSSHCG